MKNKKSWDSPLNNQKEEKSIIYKHNSKHIYYNDLNESQLFLNSHKTTFSNNNTFNKKVTKLELRKNEFDKNISFSKRSNSEKVTKASLNKQKNQFLVHLKKQGPSLILRENFMIQCVINMEAY